MIDRRYNSGKQFVMYSKEEIEAARHTDMVRFLEQHKGFSFKTSGGWLICNEHDSLKINPDRYTWHWYSRDLFGKGAIDWLCKVDGYGFRDAVSRLIGDSCSMRASPDLKANNLKVALEVQKYLEKYGVNVVMIRDDDSFLELDERCAKANNAKADMYVSLHRNSYDGDISGVEVWVNNSEPEYDTKLAQNILDDLEKVGISENRGVQYGYVGNSGVNYYINADTVMPSCLVELGFITEDIDNKLFDEHLTEYGQAIADGIVQTAVDVGLVDESGKRLMSEQLISPEKPVNNKDSSSAADAMTTPMETDSSADVYNTQENEWY